MGAKIFREGANIGAAGGGALALTVCVLKKALHFG